MSQPRRILVCEEALKNHNGHWFEYNRAVVEMHQEIGDEVMLLAHQDVESEIQKSIGAKPYFQWTNWDNIYYHPVPWLRYLGLPRHNWRVFRAVWRHLRSSEPYDLVFVPTVVLFHLVAWWFVAALDRGKRAKRIVLLFRNSTTSYESNDSKPQFSAAAKVLGFVLRRYRKMLATGLVRITSDSHRLAEEYRKLAGIDVLVTPHPCLLLAPRRDEQPRPSGSPVTFILPGPARWEKGVHILLKALRLLNKRDETPDFRVILQWPDEVLDPNGQQLRPDAMEFESVVEIIDQPLSSDDYRQLLGRADSIILPYLRQAYYARISGVAVEAMLLGIPVIYTNDTWNSDMIERYGAGIGFDNEDAGGLAQAIVTLVNELERFQTNAVEAEPEARAHFSAENFQEVLWRE